MKKKKSGIIEMVDWMATRKGLVLLIVVALFAVPLVIVHILFKLTTNQYWIYADWSSGDVISYIAGFEAFIGTTLLSILALWQNQKHKQENDIKDQKLLQIENEKIRLTNMPQFLIQSCDYTKVIDQKIRLTAGLEEHVAVDYMKTHCFLVQGKSVEWMPADRVPVIDKLSLPKFISLMNCGNNTAHQVKLKMIIGEKEYSDEKASSVVKDGELFLYLSINPSVTFNDDMILVVRFYDCFQNVYEQSFLIKEYNGSMIVKSYADIKLICKSTSMAILPLDENEKK